MHEVLPTRSGRLKIFLGAAPGTGKTYAMLRAAQARRRDGVDVVVGLIETHGRRDLEELFQGTEQIERKQVEYQGHRFGEVDVEAILHRRPELVLVDELAHSNVPGSKHPKRYLDVEELLVAGIDVWTTLNVQHVESVSERAAKITWVELQETVPDRVLELAEEVEVIDSSPTEIIRRFEAAELDSLPHSRLARRSFFTAHNLAALRELTLPLAKKRPVRKILVPFDGSPAAVRAVQHVIGLARAGHSGEVLLLNVQLPDVDANAETAGQAILNDATRLLAGQRICHHCRVTTAKPAEAIIVAAGRFQIDLIVMGTTGTSGLAKMFFGSVARHVAELSPVPVTLVR